MAGAACRCRCRTWRAQAARRCLASGAHPRRDTACLPVSWRRAPLPPPPPLLHCDVCDAGAGCREGFLRAVKGDMAALLAWKNRRTPLEL